MSASQVRTSFMHWIESPQASPEVLISLCSVPLGYLFGDGVVIEHCSATMLRRRPGARHVVLYRLRLRQSESDRCVAVELIGKRDTVKSAGKAAREFQVLQSLWGSGFGCTGRFKIPRPIHLSADRHVVLQDKARGVPLSAIMTQSGPPSLQSARLAGTWLAKMHHLGFAPPGNCSYADQIAAVRFYVSEILAAQPSWASKLELLEAQIHSDLATSESVPLALIHGDYHPQHVYVAGRNVTVIDFDRSHFSDPAVDLGCFIAHARAAAYAPGRSREVISDEIRAFLNGYFSVAPDTRIRSLARRVIAFASFFSLEALYYTARVLGVKDNFTLDLYLNGSQERGLPGLEMADSCEVPGRLQASVAEYAKAA